MSHCLLCAFSIISVPLQGQTFAFSDLDIEENSLFINKKGAYFTLNGQVILRKKGHFSLTKKALLGCWIFFFFFLGGQNRGIWIPGPPFSQLLDTCPPPPPPVLGVNYLSFLGSAALASNNKLRKHL